MLLVQCTRVSVIRVPFGDVFGAPGSPVRTTPTCAMLKVECGLLQDLQTWPVPEKLLPCLGLESSSQIFQNPLIKEHTPNSQSGSFVYI